MKSDEIIKMVQNTVQSGTEELQARQMICSMVGLDEEDTELFCQYKDLNKFAVRVAKQSGLSGGKRERQCKVLHFDNGSQSLGGTDGKNNPRLVINKADAAILLAFDGDLMDTIKKLADGETIPGSQLYSEFKDEIAKSKGKTGNKPSVAVMAKAGV